MTNTLKITNPKRTRTQNGRSAWYPYYAGFSYDFAYDLLSSANLSRDDLILDHWNGSGTTTAVADSLGYLAHGFDLNPVMVVVAKARLLNKREHPSLDPLTAEIVEKACASEVEPVANDPLQAWLCPTSADYIRKLERAIQSLLLDHEHYQLPATRRDFDALSGLGAFFYLALFRTVRKLLTRFIASNPTWVRTPRNFRLRLKPRFETIFQIFRSQVLVMMIQGHQQLFERKESGEIKVNVAASESLPLADRSVKFVLTSPPYCTRIDYAVATKPELAVLGYSEESFKALRKSLLGTPTVPRSPVNESAHWGSTCLTFLEQLKSHESRASMTYYYKNHLQYFDGIFKSLTELRRVLAKDSTCVLVVQDSYYKNILNDLPMIITEMARSNSLELARRQDFPHTRTMAAVNPAARLYRKDFSTIESVLVFRRAA